MIAAYVARHLPSALTKQFLLNKPTAQDARLFCAGYKACPAALDHSSLSALLQTPELWLKSIGQMNELKQESNTQINMILVGKRWVGEHGSKGS